MKPNWSLINYNLPIHDTAEPEEASRAFCRMIVYECTQFLAKSRRSSASLASRRNVQTTIPTYKVRWGSLKLSSITIITVIPLPFCTADLNNADDDYRPRWSERSSIQIYILNYIGTLLGQLNSIKIRFTLNSWTLTLPFTQAKYKHWTIDIYVPVHGSHHHVSLSKSIVSCGRMIHTHTKSLRLSINW